MRRLAVFSGSDMRTFGGGEKYVVELINRLRGFDVTIFSYRGRPPFRQTGGRIKKMVNAEIEYYNAPEIPVLKERFMFTRSGFEVLSKLKEFDVVYSLDDSFFTNLLLCSRSKKYGFRYILGVHDANILRDEPIKATFARRLLLKVYSPVRNFGMMRAPNIRVINDLDGKKLRGIGYGGHVYSITDFVNVDRAVPRVNKNEFVVLFVGRLSIEHKGIDLLESIIENTLGRDKSIHFEIVGSGDDGKDIVEGLVERHPDNVKWLGFVSEKKLVEEYNNASVLVFPSRFESFGLSLAEGQAYGLPAVAFDVRGPDVIIKNRLQGRLVKPFDVESFVSEILGYHKLWKNDKEDYLRIKRSVSNMVIDRFGEKAILPKVMKMLTSEDGGPDS
jgi:glycosyltransferase involved in cell wall biosynthesis